MFVLNARGNVRGSLYTRCDGSVSHLPCAQKPIQSLHSGITCWCKDMLYIILFLFFGIRSSSCMLINSLCDRSCLFHYNFRCREQIIFTSGATESNNMSIKGVARFYKGRKKHIITTQTEHKCVLDSCRAMEQEGYEVSLTDGENRGSFRVTNVAFGRAGNMMSWKGVLVSGYRLIREQAA